MDAETRTVQLVGGSTYSVSLLKEWADEQGVQAGTDVYLHPHVDGSLVVQPDPGSAGWDADVSVPADGLKPATLERTIHAMYVAGYDTIAVVADDGFDADARRTIAEAATALIGTEVAEEDGDRIVIRSLLDSDDVSVRQSVLRLQHVTLEMHEDATAALFEGSVDPARVVERDTEADRLFAMVARHFRRGLVDLSVIDRLGVDRSTLFEYYTAARQLERIADHAETLATIAGDSDGPIDRTLAGPASTARELVKNAMTALLDGDDVDTAYRALDTRDDLLDELESLDRSHGDRDAGYRLPLVVDSITRTAEHGGTIAEVAIRSTP